jgi:hypothetical protein
METGSIFHECGKLSGRSVAGQLQPSACRLRAIVLYSDRHETRQMGGFSSNRCH